MSLPNFKRGSQWLGYGLVGFVVVWGIRAFSDDLGEIDPRPYLAEWPIVTAVISLSLFNFTMRAARWQLFLWELGFRLPWRYVLPSFVAGFAFTLVPGKVGELLMRVHLYHPHGLTATKATSSFFVERLTDLLALIVLSLGVLAGLRDHSLMLWSALAAVTASIAAIIWLPWSRIAAAKGPGRMFLQPIAGVFAQAHRFLRPSLFSAALGLALLAWSAQGVGLALLCAAVIPGQVSLGGALGSYALGLLAGALLFLPGGLGGTEATMVTLLHSHGVAIPQALLLTLVFRVATLWLAFAMGWGCWLCTRGRGKPTLHSP